MNNYVDFSEASIRAINEHLLSHEQHPDYRKYASDCIRNLDINGGVLAIGQAKWLAKNMKFAGRELPEELAPLVKGQTKQPEPDLSAVEQIKHRLQQTKLSEPVTQPTMGLVERLVAVLEKLEARL